jgi:competence protein ComGC
MKRQTYVDQEGNQINQALEQKRPLLDFLFVIGNILPIVIIIFIIVTVVQNNECKNVYEIMESASLKYAKDQGELPNLEGENVSVKLDSLYSNQYISSTQTENTLCSGSIKITRYKKKYVYTVDTSNCDKCSVNQRYGRWSNEVSSYPYSHTIVDVIPYYNYYDREVGITKWSDYYDDSYLSDEVSKYGIRLPLDETKIPTVPGGSKTINIQNDTTYYYRYRDRSWKWYDIVGDYSDFSSERPDGYANKDEDSSRTTKVTEYSLNYPAEKDYRTIQQTTGYKFYYENKEGKKIYYNSGKYTATEDVNTTKYNKRDEQTSTLYRYYDKQWRWYNGTKRHYTSYSTTPRDKQTYKDTETEKLSDPTTWDKKSSINASNQEYRVEEKKLMTRFRCQYEILSLRVLKEPLNHDAFVKKVKTSIPEFSSLDNVKLEVTYKFKYRN